MQNIKQNSLGFDELHDQLVAAGGGAVEIAIGNIAGELASALQDYLGIATLKLQQFRMLEQSEAALRIITTIKLPVPGNSSRKVDIVVDARFMRAGKDIGYTIVFAISPSAARAMLGDLGHMLSALPLQMNGLWLSLSSDTRGTLRIETPGLELGEAVIEAGRGYMFRLGGRLLKNLKLEQTIFYLTNFPDSLRFTTKTHVVIPIGPLLQFTVQSIAVEGAEAIGFTGEGLFDFFGQKLAFQAMIRLTGTGISFGIDLGRFIPQIDQALFRPLTLTRAVASFNGSLTSYAVGVEGDFVIAGSGNTGGFSVKYSTGAPNMIPDLFELESNRLILSDLATLATGFTVTLPPLLDRMIVLEKSYIYFAKQPGLITRCGIASVAGIRAHSNINILGYKTYGEVSAVAGNKIAAKFQFAPIKLGKIIEISGSGQGSPQRFSGHQVGKNAIAIDIDSENRSASASLKVKIFGQNTIDAIGVLTERSLNFIVKSKLPMPLGDSDFAAALEHETVTLTTRASMAVDVKAEWYGGGLVISKAVQVDVGLQIVAKPNSATGRADVRASLGPIKLAFPIDFDPLDMNGLIEQIRNMVKQQILEALKTAVVWLRAVLDGTIEFLRDTRDLAGVIGHELRNTFNQTAKEAAKALRQAGYQINNAYLVLEEGFRASWDNIKDFLQDAGGYAEREVVEWIHKICDVDEPKFTARTIAGIFLNNGYGMERAIAEVHQMLKDVKLTAEVIGQLRDSPREVAQFLLKAHVDAKKAAEYIAEGFYRLSKEAVITTLTETGYTAREVTRAVENVWRESGRVIDNIRNELSRTWNRYKPRVTIRWRVSW